MISGFYKNNPLKLSYIFIVLVSSYQIYSRTMVSDIAIFRLLFDKHLGLIPYLLICLIGYFVLFTDSASKFTDDDRFIFGIALVLVISAVGLTYAGGRYRFNTDNDTALEAWIQAFFSGKYPYEATSHMGNPITPLPFLHLYSIPYYILGDVALQNIVNIFILQFILWGVSSNRDQLKFGLIATFISLPLYYFLLTQSDHFTVSILITLGIYLFYKNKFTTGSVLFGCLIATKAYAWLIIPTSLYYLKRKEGNKRMMKSAFIYLFISSIFILPFVLWNPHVFFTKAPLGAAKDWLSGFPLIPYPEYVITALTVLLSLSTLKISKDIFVSFFSTYLFFGLFLFLKVKLLITLSVTLLGIIYYNNKISTLSENIMEPSK